jgi:hypothetical protein
MIRSIRRLALAGALAGSLLLGACSSPGVERYADARPILTLEDYFDGTVDAWGIVMDRSGEVIRRFSVTIEGRWQDGKGELDERFVYADGERETRVWKIERTAQGRYVGRADDVVGTASGTAAGNALNWAYTLRVPVGDSIYEIDFDDWMFLVDEQTLINRALMSKFGFRVGEVLITFKRRSAS